jgi:hypothetical protein
MVSHSEPSTRLVQWTRPLRLSIIPGVSGGEPLTSVVGRLRSDGTRESFVRGMP